LPLFTPSIFVDLAELDAVKEYIWDQEKIHKIPKKVRHVVHVLMIAMPDIIFFFGQLKWPGWPLCRLTQSREQYM
jgi:hypothetical protein